MGKFAVGEKAIFAIAHKCFDRIGEIVTVKEIGPFRRGDFHPGYFKIHPKDSDYIVECSDGFALSVTMDQLRKLPGDSKEDFIPPAVRKLFTPKVKELEASNG